MVHLHCFPLPVATTNWLPAATKADVEAHFATHGTGEITEVKLMNGFGFIEYKDAMDARDVVPGSHAPFNRRLLWIQSLLTSRALLPPSYSLSYVIAPNIFALPMDPILWENASPFSLPVELDTEKADLKDFARQSSLDVVYSETGRDSNGRGFVEFETAADLRTAVEKLDGREFKGSRVQCLVDTQPDMPPRGDRGRSRSPGRRPYPPPAFDNYDRRGPPHRGYNRETGPSYGYRDRSPRREYYDDRAPRYRSPPRRPVEDYPPPRGRYEEPYRRDYPPPPDPYANGGRPAYDRPPREFPPREPAYPREGAYARDYDRGGRYW
ncbi:uncharacterized protein Triagg1_9755 [Trichoderma aggressivum f. europaeum]|uniref:RRM domain-containing protein n=1 Tax=Trichoderma aggressivum f. europaeum TaxID=173218 RepID=A0AAE1LWW6_9HYPO|nr:hypothetical protein Triagg1_9755 [Trichoderma aggressivum f. europaeum]